MEPIKTFSIVGAVVAVGIMIAIFRNPLQFDTYVRRGIAVLLILAIPLIAWAVNWSFYALVPLVLLPQFAHYVIRKNRRT